MTMAYRHVIEQQLDENALTSPGAKLRFYDVGTTTPRVVYSDTALTIAIAQPIIADAAGRFPQVYLQPGVYKYTVHDVDDVLISSNDNVDPGFSGGVTTLEVSKGGTGASTAAGARTNLGVPSIAVTDALDDRLADVEAELDAPLTSPPNVDTYAASYTPSFAVHAVQSITLTGGITINAPSSAAVGTTVTVILIQDATGSRSVAWNSAFKFPGGSPPAASRTANAVDVFSFYVRSAGVLESLSIKISDVRPIAGPDIILQDRQTAGVAGGTATSGSVQIRTLNTKTIDRISGCSLASNLFTLSIPGTYYIEWSAPAYACNAHQTQLINVTGGGAVLEYGKSMSSSSNTSSDSDGGVYHTITASNTYQIGHRVAATSATNGFGLAGSFGTEIYTTVKIWKVV